MSIKKAVLAILPLSLLVGLVAHSFATPKQSSGDGSFLFARTLEKNDAAMKYADPVDLSGTVLKTKLLSSSISKTSQSFTISFSTGGVGWFNGLRKTVLVASENPEFEEYYNDFNSKTEEQKNEMLEEEGFEPLSEAKFAKDLSEIMQKNGTKPNHNLPADNGKTARGYVGFKLKQMPPAQNIASGGKA